MELKVKKQFRVGNYYQPTDGSNVDFAEVTAGDIYAWLDRGAIYGKPILLTEEWLIKLGVKRKFLHIQTLENKILRMDCNSVDDIALWISEDEDTLEEKDSSFNLKNLRYVHQLQNLYFVLTNEELLLETFKSNT